VHRFAESLAGVLGLTAAFQHVTACPQTWQLGTYIPLSGHSYPAYLTIQDSPDQAYAVAVRLAGIAAGPLLLFVPTRRVIDPVTSELVTRSQSRLIALEDAVPRQPCHLCRPHHRHRVATLIAAGGRVRRADEEAAAKADDEDQVPSAEEQCSLCLDLDRFVAGLPDRLRSCYWLIAENRRAAAVALGLHRSSLYEAAQD
jgi:hypothetical protein